LPRLAVLSVLSAASSPCPDLNLIHYKTVWGGAGKSAIRSASIPKCQPFGKKTAAIFAAAIGAEIGMYDGGYHTK